MEREEREGNEGRRGYCELTALLDARIAHSHTFGAAEKGFVEWS